MTTTPSTRLPGPPRQGAPRPAGSAPASDDHPSTTAAAAAGSTTATGSTSPTGTTTGTTTAAGGQRAQRIPTQASVAPTRASVAPTRASVAPTITSRRRGAARSTGVELLPSVVVPGVSHSGAAALTADLGRHPEVCLPDVKRIGLFTPLRYGRPVDAPLEDYDRHFAAWSGQRHRVENAPDYFDGGRTMARALDEAIPGVRVILVLRNPAHRLWTAYTDKLGRGRLPRAMTYDTFVDRSLALRANGADRFEANRHFRTLSSGYYVEYLPAWLDTFGRRARVVFAEDLHDEPAAHVGALFDWLGIDPAAVPAPERPTTYPDSPADASAGRRFWPVLPQGLRREGTPARRLPRQSERARTRVSSLYAGANRELAGMLRDFGYAALPEWLTEG